MLSSRLAPAKEVGGAHYLFGVKAQKWPVWNLAVDWVSEETRTWGWLDTMPDTNTAT